MSHEVAWGRTAGPRRSTGAETRARRQPSRRRAASLGLVFLLLSAAFLVFVLPAPAAQGISLRGAASANNGAGATTLSIAMPTGTVQYDVMVAQVTVRGGTGTTITPPSGWTLILRTDSSTTLAQALYYKVAGAAEAGPYAWTFSSSLKASGGIIAYGGVDNANPVDASVGQENAASTSATAPSVTTTVANTLLVGFFGMPRGTTFTPPAGMTERFDDASTGGGAATRTTSEAADDVFATAGATGTRVATAAASDVNIGQLVALRPPAVSFSTASSSGAESATPVTLTVTLSSASSLSTTVDYAATGGTAAGGGTDYTLAAGTLTFAAGTTSQTISVTIADDSLDEADETVLVTLSNPGNANLGATTGHTYTITDNDPAPSVTLGLTGSPMAEASGAAIVTATLSAASGQTITVNLAFSGTATLTSDYTRSGTSLSLSPGSTSGTITLTAVQDSVDEPSETIVVDIDTVVNGVESGTQQVTANITDDDPAPSVTLSLTGSPMAEASGSSTVTATLSAASGLDVTVNLAFSGTATLTSDYTRSGTSIVISAGGTTGSITLTAVQDTVDEVTESIIVDIGTVTNGVESGTQQVSASIIDDDDPTVTLSLTGSPMAEASGSATVTATLSAASSQDVTVNLAFGGTATLTLDYTRSGTSIVVPAGSTTGSITLTAVQDTLDEANETIIVDIDTVVNGIESGTQQVTATITDDDPSPSVTLSLSGSPMAEASGTATVTATLSAISSQDVTVNLAFSGSATLTTDYTRSGTSIVISAGGTTGSITLTAVQDTVDEVTETIIVDISTVVNGVESGPQQVTASIIDDDEPTVTLSLTGSPMAEAAGSATVTATLGAVPAQDVTVNLAISGTASLTSDYTRSGTSIVVPAGSTTGSITLTAVQDTLDEPDETVVVDIDTVVNGAESGTQQVTATITDDDSAPSVTLSLIGSPMLEASGTATVTATLSAASGQTVTVNLAFSGTATLTSDYARSGTSITISPGATTGTITLTAVTDTLDEANETAVVDIDTVTNGVESGTQQVTATITDDDPASTVTLSLTGSPMAEASGSSTVTATLSAASGQTATVNLAFSGAATLTSDYTRSGTSIVISAGGTSGSIALTAVQDTLDEPDETVIVDIDTVTNGVESGTQQVTATITDDDPAPTVTLSLTGSPMAEASGTSTVTATLSAASGQTVTVNLVFSGTATLTSDYTRSGTSIAISPGATTGSITLTAVSDALDEPSETIVVDIDTVTNGVESGTQQVTATITDDDPAPTVTLSLTGSPMAEASGSATVTATLSAASGQTVTVNLAFSGAATLTSDYTRSGTSIAIAPGSTSGSITLTAVQDTLDEAAETILVDIDAVTNGVESGTQQVTATITDDDPAPSVTLSLTGSPMAEASGSATVTAALSAASGLTVTVNLAFSGTATLTSDYTRSGTSVSISPGSTTGSITLTAVQDTLDEADETVVVDIDTVTNGVESGTQQVTATITDDDPSPSVTLSLSGSPMAEASGVATVTATLSAASGQTVTVNLAFSGTATLTSDYTRSGTSITISPGATTGTSSLTAVQDTLDEPSETIVVDIDTVVNGVESGTQQVTASITDDDPPTVTVTATDASASEPGANTGTFTFTRTTGDTSAALTVNYAVSGTATAGSDYTSLTGSVTILVGAADATVLVVPLDDTASEADETVAATIAADAAYVIGSPGSATVTITDNDPPVVTVTATDAAASEPGTDTGTFTISRTGDTSAALTVLYSASGTTTSGSDYSSLGTSVTIGVGASSAPVTVTPLDDALDEADETVILTISPDPAYAVGSPSSATVTVTDNDPAPSVTLSLNGSPMAEASGGATVTATLSVASGQTVTVNLAFSGTATLTSDYTRSGTSIAIAPGATTGSVTLTAVQDSLDEPDETIVVDVDTVVNGVESGTQQVTATITDDDATPAVTLSLTGSPVLEASGAATVTATLSAASGQTVTVNLAFSGTATLASDYTRSGASISISPGATSGSVTLAAVQDSLDEPNETVAVDIDTVTNGVESGTQQVTASITDDDPAPSVTLSLTGSPVAEASGVATVTATLSAASGQTVTVSLAFSGTATLTSDYTRSGTSITISPGATTGSITLTSVTDALHEANETVVVDIDTVVNGVENGVQEVIATITDDDPAPFVTLSHLGSPMAEASGSGTVTATLSAASGQSVTVSLAFGGTATLTSDYTRSGTSITISPGATTGSITLAAVQDTADEPDETIVVDIASVVNGVESGTQQVTATLADDDGSTPAVTLSLAGSPMAEASGSSTVTATLSAASGLDVTVNLAFSGTAALTSDYVRSGTSIVIAPGGMSGSITLTAAQDALDEANETIVVDIDSVTNAVEPGTQQVTATIADDDAAPTVTLGLTGSPMVEASGAATVTATLSAASGQTVAVSLAFSGTAKLTSDYTRSGESISIAPGSTTGSITLAAAQDGDDEPNETVVVDVDAVTNGVESGTQQVTATITDDDPAAAGGGGGGSWVSSTGTADQSATALPMNPPPGAERAYTANVLDAAAGTSVEVLIGDPELPRAFLDLGDDASGATFTLVKWGPSAPPPGVALPTGLEPVMFLDLELEGAEGAIGRTTLPLSLDASRVAEPGRVLFLHWDGERWVALHRIKVACDGSACAGDAQTTHFSRFAIAIDQEAPRVGLAPPMGPIGVQRLAVEASDNLAVSRVVLYLDGVEWGEDLEAPYAFDLDLDSLGEGEHLARATAWDVAGNSATVWASFVAGPLPAIPRAEEEEGASRPGATATGGIGAADLLVPVGVALALLLALPPLRARLMLIAARFLRRGKTRGATRTRALTHKVRAKPSTVSRRRKRAPRSR